MGTDGGKNKLKNASEFPGQPIPDDNLRPQRVEANGVLQLIPGLPNDIVLNQVVSKLPWKAFHILSSVSRPWRDTIQSRQVYDARVRANSLERVVVFSQIHPTNWRIRTMSIYSMRDDSWHLLPTFPFDKRGIPPYCQITALDGRLYVLGGEEPDDDGYVENHFGEDYGDDDDDSEDDDYDDDSEDDDDDDDDSEDDDDDDDSEDDDFEALDLHNSEDSDDRPHFRQMGARITALDGRLYVPGGEEPDDDDFEDNHSAEDALDLHNTEDNHSAEDALDLHNSEDDHSAEDALDLHNSEDNHSAEDALDLHISEDNHSAEDALDLHNSKDSHDRPQFCPMGAQVFVLDLAGQTGWKRCASMPKPRYDFGCGVLDGKVYVLGGYSCSRYTRRGTRVYFDWHPCGKEISECLVYDPKQDRWSSIAPIRVQRITDTLDVVPVGDELWVRGEELGGEQFGPAPSAMMAEVYNPGKDRWDFFVDSEPCHESERLFTFKGKLYLMTPTGIYGREVSSEKESWTRLRSVCIPELLEVDYEIEIIAAHAVDDEILALLFSGYGRKMPGHMFRSKGFGIGKETIELEIVDTQIFNCHTPGTALMRPIEL